MKTFSLLRCLYAQLACAVCIAIATAAVADTVTLKNGDRLTGKLVSLEKGTLTFESEFGQKLTLPADKIVGMTTDDPVTVRVRNGGVFSGRLQGAYGMIAIANDRANGAARVPVEKIAEIYPGIEPRKTFKWTGRVDVGVTERSGNTNSTSLNLDADVVARGEDNRFTFRGEFNREIDDSNRTEDNAFAKLQHDNFVSEQIYFYTNGSVRRDQPQDLRLRTVLGTGVGYQAFETDTTFLSLEAGPAYTNEDYFESTDEDYVSGRWAVDFRYKFWDRKFEFFHRHEGLADLENTGDYVIDSSTGVRAPLGAGFNATARLDVDYDNNPPEGSKTTDRAFILTVGYSW